MAYVIGADCADVLDLTCVEECPVDCIYEGDRKSYINPRECIDCGACEPVCPVSAIAISKDAEPAHVADNAAFFAEPLPGQPAPLGNPGGSMKIGPVGIDTPLGASLPPGEG